MSLSQQLAEYISACFTGLWIQSHEHDDALTEIAQLCREHQWRLATWDIAQGLQLPGQGGNADAGGGDPLAAIRSINALATPDGSALLVLRNFHRFLGSPEIVQALAHQISHGKAQPHVRGGPVADRAASPSNWRNSSLSSSTSCPRGTSSKKSPAALPPRRANCRKARTCRSSWTPPPA